MTARRVPVSVVEAARGLDLLLFERSGWFAIDASNVRVPGVRPGSLDAALALVGSGAVVSVVGRLRPEVAGIDVDAAGELGAIVVETLTGWCRSRGLWHLVRASGGGPGRAHVLVVPGVHRDALVGLVEQLRGELGLSHTKVDVRDRLRPLSAPHRRTGVTAPLEAAPTALADLHAVLDLLASPTAAGGRPARPSTTSTRRPRAGLVPAVAMRRRRRDLPPAWARYLAEGQRPVDAEGEDRSGVELAATFQLVIAGYEEPAAWEAITRAHPDAFTKSRSLGRSWWWYLWNAAVESADTWRTEHLTPPTPRSTQASLEVLRDASTAVMRDGSQASGWPRPTRPAAKHDASSTLPPSAVAVDEEAQRARAVIAQVRGVVAGTWRSWPRRTRHADLELVQVVLDRMDRVGSTAVAIPQRDLVLDTTLRSRATVVAALRRLTTVGVWRVLSTYQPGTTDTANTIALEPAQEMVGRAVPQLGPSSVSLPLAPPLPLRLRRALPSPTHAHVAATLASLTTPPAAAGVPVEVLADLAGLLPDGAGEATLSQLRTLRGYLDTLASLGLATVDLAGGWRAVDHEDEAGHDARAELELRGEQLHHAVAREVSAERAAFRARLDPATRRAAWESQRAAAIARDRKRDLARHKQWREQHPDELAQWQEAGRSRYAAMSIQEQARTRHRLATRRAADGVSEQDRYDAWVAAIGPHELATRSVERAAAFDALPGPAQRARAMMWATHRAAWPLTTPRPRRPVDPPPPEVDDLPEASLLRRPVPLLDDAALTFTPRVRRTRRIGR
ncbi:hypothetical protein [Miniimonas sp. S16]|uniref:hypothetical protein n=1 Tax=Miniimonas sp. S16 TaxID=2171623 RepID=UPI00131EFBAC|nr:hypothetical protein [Miniimonas sp. S16]